MGFKLSISCKNCGFEKRFTVGTSDGDNSIEAAIDQLHHMRRPKVLKLLNEHKVHVTDFDHRIYRCGACGLLRNSFWIRIIYDDDQVYETGFLCGKCQRPMTQVREHHQLNNIPCPCCNVENLKVTMDNQQ